MKHIAVISVLSILLLPLNSCKTGGIMVFTKEGCSRCEYTINYFKQNNISYTEYSADTDKEKMWNLITQSKPDAESVTMPVIVKEGNVYFSIENLEEFLKKTR